MKAKRTLAFAILFLTILAWGLVPAQAAAPVGAAACAWQAQIPVAPTPAAAQAELQATPVSVPITALAAGRTSSDLGCLSFCSIALCPQGTTCGPSPDGGCGCNPDGGGVLGAEN